MATDFHIEAISDAQTLIFEKFRTLQGLLDHLLLKRYSVCCLDTVIDRWIEEWRKVRDTSDKEFIAPITTFIEYLHKLVSGSKQVVINELEKKIAELGFDEADD